MQGGNDEPVGSERLIPALVLNNFSLVRLDRLVGGRRRVNSGAVHRWRGHHTTTHRQGLGQPGPEVVEDDGDDVLVGDVDVAGLQVHPPAAHQVQRLLERYLHTGEGGVTSVNNKHLVLNHSALGHRLRLAGFIGEEGLGGSFIFR